MGSGLIWAGIGQGISNAGSMYGQAVLQEARDNMLLEREKVLEQLRENRQIKLEETKEENRIAREERQAQERAAESRKASQIADETARKREEERAARDQEAAAREQEQLSGAAAKVRENNAASASIPQRRSVGKGTITQAPQASDQEIQDLIKANPQAYDLYEKAGLIEKAQMRDPNAKEKAVDPRLQRTEDEYNAAVSIGAHSSVLESFDKKRARVLDEIRLENQEKRDRARADLENRREDRRSNEFASLLPIRQQQADASTTNANRPRGGGGAGADPNKPATTADMQRQVTAAENQLATELGVAKKDVNEEIRILRKRADAGNAQAKATLDRVTPMINELSSANRRMLDFKRPSSSSSAGSTSSGRRDYSNLW